MSEGHVVREYVAGNTTLCGKLKNEGPQKSP